MDYYAHVSGEKKQNIADHLKNVAEMASDFAVDFMKEIVYEAGNVHDIGKYSTAFQKRLKGSKIKYEHSSCGAIEINKIDCSKHKKLIAFMLMYCIAGHHTGLPDGGTEGDSAGGDVTLYSRLKREENYINECDYSAYNSEIKLRLPDAEEIVEELQKSYDKTDCLEKYAFFTRYLFSCLTDADFLDTELFCNDNKTVKKLSADFNLIEKAVSERLALLASDTTLRAARGRLQSQAVENSREPCRISILNMPTGSGKTLCSLQIALQKLRNSGKKRIIYVIPYTSIIEQTAETFENIFGTYADILQHHSNFCADDSDKEPDTVEKLKKASENWDAPIIITTNVQFFQSIYHYKSSRLRKLHNMADSIIIFDEVHMLPVEMLQPCLRGIGYITNYLNSEAIFLSATMPDYSLFFKRLIPDCTVNELIKNKSDFMYFQNCCYTDLGETDFDNIIEKAQQYTNSLIIVNSRKSAREIYSKLSGRKYHLSTYMTPADRSEVIKEIRSLLNNNECVTVVSTSLVEAGVDLDFEAVFRQLAGLDSILQSGGRCNREGLREYGNVYIFETDDKPKGDMQIRADITRNLLKNNENISSEHCIKEYYDRLFGFSDEVIRKNSIASDCNGFDNIPFRTYAKEFRLIRDDTIGLIIDNCTESSELLYRLENGDASVRRKLQKYTVSLRIHGEFDHAMSLGLVRDTGMGVFVLSNNDYYRCETGLDLNMTQEYII